MNLKQLEAFVEVAEKNSFSKAAKSLYLTKPTVSAHISALEKELGSRLLIRNTKEVELSESGKRLYEYAKQIVLLTAQIEQEFGKKERRGEKPYFTIAASTVPAQYLLPNLLMRFRNLYPMDQFRILESDSAGVVEKVAARKADIGLAGTDTAGKYCEFLPFYEDELIVITPNTVKFQNRKQTGNALDWIAGEPILLREEGSGTRKETMRILQKAGIEEEQLQVIASIENPETIKRSVASGMGISVLSALSAQDAVSSGQVLAFPLGEERSTREIYVVYNKNFQLAAGAVRFLKLIQKMYLLPESSER